VFQRLFSQCAQYRQTNFATCPDDRPVIAQFCGDDPNIIVQASNYLEQSVDAIDINFGCPQVCVTLMALYMDFYKLMVGYSKTRELRCVSFK
jgi:tRNA-dihydrouridine synthase